LDLVSQPVYRHEMTNIFEVPVNLPNLRKWQLEAYSKWVSENRKGIVEVATAGGKTRFALECLFLYLKEIEKPKVVIITPTTALSDQWVIALTDDANIPISEINVWPEEQNTRATYQIMVINTARRVLPQIVRNYPDAFVIADECHRYASEENSRAFEETMKFTLGLTATAEREYDDGLNLILKPALGEVIYEYSIIDARRDEIVAPFEMVNVEIPLDADEQKSYDKLSYQIAKAFNENEVEKAKILSMRRASISKNSIHRIPACISLVQSLPDEKIVIFHESIFRAEEIHSQLVSLGFSAGIYHSEIPGPRRRENLRQFKKGILRVIVACRALDEGVDIPDANVAIVVASTSSLRQRVQRIGRVIRKHPSKEFATIYTFYGSPKESTTLIDEMNRLDSIAPTKWLRANPNV
jgi:superfamily II DNA or RNA helicase